MVRFGNVVGPPEGFVLPLDVVQTVWWTEAAWCRRPIAQHVLLPAQAPEACLLIHEILHEIQHEIQHEIRPKRQLLLAAAPL
jgi:hypothetical protein